ncbi:hypothetical protein BBJ28_00011977 [Nothophytophthora sp. Chile5]|nr:hypothetical protein BBJ28_00011977 [Nothophytophthora sp. Chile5]
MAQHQAHRLPWVTLGEIYQSGEEVNGWYRYQLTTAQDKQLAHFARCLAAALQEFAATDKRPPVDEGGNSLDPATWGIEAFGSMGYTGFYYSLLGGYVQLNLLLMDPEVYLPIVQRGKDAAPHFLLVLCGHCDGGLPEWMARRLRPILRGDDPFRLKPLTAEVLQNMRDHCALIFRCLYSISGENRAFDPETLLRCIAP